MGLSANSNAEGRRGKDVDMKDFFDTRAALRERLAVFLPERIFDAHAHVYDASFMPSYADKPEHAFGRSRVGAAEYRQGMEALMYGRCPQRVMLLPTPDPMMRDRANGLCDAATACVAEELRRDPGCYGAAYVLPGDTEADIEAMLDYERIRGLKCYYYASPNGNQGPANEFLPESAWRVAERRGMTITLHLACDGAMSDPRNLEYVEAMARRHPGAVLILAHAGRAFAEWTCVEPVKRLTGLDNIWFDLSAICEPAPMMACIRAAGVDRVMWGSDYPCCCFVGRAVSFADQFAWVDEKALRACGFRGEVFTVLEENLIATWIVADLLDLTPGDVRKIFAGNAERLFCHEER